MLSALALAACDSGGSAPSQGGPSEESGAAAVSAPSEGFENGDGITAALSRAFKGRPAPDIVFQAPNGKPARIADFRGRPVLLNLWATWCAPCKAEMPTLARLAKREGDALMVLTVSQDGEGVATAKSWLDAQKLALPAYADPDNRFLTALGGEIALPTTILYGADGKEVWRMIGPLEWDDPVAAELIAEAKTAA